MVLNLFCAHAGDNCNTLPQTGNNYFQTPRHANDTRTTRKGHDGRYCNGQYLRHNGYKSMSTICKHHYPSDLCGICNPIQHFAPQCREALMEEALKTQRRVVDWRSQSDEGMRLLCGELTAKEIRTIRAVLNSILPPNSETSDKNL